jgi:carboxyl-terminal processing protease
MGHQHVRRGGWFRLTLASLLSLVLGAASAGIILSGTISAGGARAGSLAASVESDFKLMAQAWELIEKHYVDRSAIQPQRMTYAAISGMVESLGDTGHSTFLTPQMVRDSREELQGHFPGIGAEVQMKDNQVVIAAPLDHSPAEKAGLRAGDIIFKVDGKNVAGESLQQVVGRIRGPAGTTVVLSIRDPHTDRIRDVSIVRADIQVQSVTWRFLPATRIADIRIAQFSEGTAKSLQQITAQASTRGARALVLDLRNNPGGLLTQAVAVASHFLQAGNVLLEKNARGQVHPVAVKRDGLKVTLPMAVLTNAGTASAAEIVAGALQDANRATVVGEKTFGTGTVLEQFPLSDGSALMLAVEEWLTPDGHTIWHKGIEPDVTVALSARVQPLYPDALEGLSAEQLATSKDVQLLRALSLLEEQEQQRPRSALRSPPAWLRIAGTGADRRPTGVVAGDTKTRLARCRHRSSRAGWSVDSPCGRAAQALPSAARPEGFSASRVVSRVLP